MLLKLNATRTLKFFLKFIFKYSIDQEIKLIFVFVPTGKLSITEALVFCIALPVSLLMNGCGKRGFPRLYLVV